MSDDHDIGDPVTEDAKENDPTAQMDPPSVEEQAGTEEDESALNTDVLQSGDLDGGAAMTASTFEVNTAELGDETGDDDDGDNDERVTQEEEGEDMPITVDVGNEREEEEEVYYEEDESEYEDDEEEEDESDLPPDHPLLEEAQKALKEQLERQLYRAETRLIEKNEEKLRLDKEREAIGESLYNRQVEMQNERNKLKKQFELFDLTQNQRIEQESGLDDLRNLNNELNERVKHQNTICDNTHKTFDEMNEDLRRLQIYEMDLKSDINEQKRQALSQEEIMDDIEQIKTKQDLLIESINREILESETQINIYKTQIQKQLEESSKAKIILKNCKSEMDLIKGEKREYLNKWNSAIIEIKKRNNIIYEINEQMNKIKQQCLNHKLEIKLIKKDYNLIKQKKINPLILQNEQLQLNINLIYQKSQMIENKIFKELNKEILLIKNKYELIINNDIKLILNDKKLLNETKIINEKKYECLMNDIKLIKDKTNDKIQQYKMINFTHEYNSKELTKIQHEIDDYEFDIESFNNDISNLKLNLINLESIINELNDKFLKKQLLVNNKEQIINEYHIQFKEQIELSHKKQMILDKLNKKYETLIAGINPNVDSAGVGNNNKNNNDLMLQVTTPMENTMINLRKEINDIDERCQELQKQWICKQTELVDQIKLSDEEKLQINKLKNKEIILKQTKLRLEHNINELNQEIKDIKSLIHRLVIDLKKLNEHISSNQIELNKLKQSYNNLNIKFQNELDSLESEIVDYQCKIDSVHQERIENEQRILTLQKQLLIWERNIELEHETQSAIDPNQGNSQIHQMKKEIHSMENKLVILRRKQEQILADMKTSIYKKEIFKIKDLGKSQQKIRQDSLTKQIHTLHTAIKTSKKQLLFLIKRLESMNSKNAEMNAQLRQVKIKFNQAMEKSTKLKEEVVSSQIEKDLVFEQVVTVQKVSQEMEKRIMIQSEEEEQQHSAAAVKSNNHSGRSSNRGSSSNISTDRSSKDYSENSGIQSQMNKLILVLNDLSLKCPQKKDVFNQIKQVFLTPDESSK